MFPKHSYTSKTAGHPHWEGRGARRTILCSGQCSLHSHQHCHTKNYKVSYSHKEHILTDLTALIHSNDCHTDFHSSGSYLSSHPHLYSYQFFNITLNSQCLEIKQVEIKLLGTTVHRITPLQCPDLEAAGNN